MIGFFDTSVHVALLRGTITMDGVLARVAVGPVRLSPVVAGELLRGSRGRARRMVERLVAGMVTIEPPSWRMSFLEAGRLLPRIFEHHDQRGLARLQNDLLIALTARHTGMLLVTLDAHFEAIRRHMPFRVVLLETPHT
jgi:predicted nucleic acid-binding protein